MEIDFRKKRYVLDGGMGTMLQSAGMSPEEAVHLLSQDPGFDPAVVAALAQLPPDAVQRAIETPVADDGQENSGPVDEQIGPHIDPTRD